MEFFCVATTFILGSTSGTESIYRGSMQLLEFGSTNWEGIRREYSDHVLSSIPSCVSRQDAPILYVALSLHFYILLMLSLRGLDDSS